MRRKIYSPYNPPEFSSVGSVGESITVQGLVTSLSVILNGGDDNNMQTLELGYSEEVRDLYPEMFGRPTKYEMEYYQKENQEGPGGPSDVQLDAPPDSPPSSPVSPSETSATENSSPEK